jgi:hypothetical protein
MASDKLIALLLGAAMINAPIFAQAQETIAAEQSLQSRAAQVARDAQSTQALYDARRLQVAYSHFAQFGMWEEMADLFASTGELIHGNARIRGRAQIARFLAEKYSDGDRGLPDGQMAALLPFSPIANLSEDGSRVNVRWHELGMLGGGEAEARWEGGIYENQYVLEDGKWRIAVQHFHPQYAGSYAEGWRNVLPDLPVVPYHYNPTSAGIPIPEFDAPAATGDPLQIVQAADASLSRLLVENEIRNLQNVYGYYLDREMWDDVADLFLPAATVDVAGVGIWAGQQSIRRGLERMGAPGIDAGELNDHLQFPLVVTMSDDLQTARARGMELGMLGENNARGYWTLATFENTYRKVEGVWQIAEMRVFPQMRADVQVGWGGSTLGPAQPEDAHRPDGQARAAAGAIPAFSYAHPVTGAALAIPARQRSVAPLSAMSQAAGERALTATADARTLLAEAERKQRIAVADVGTINVSNAFGNYIDDFEWEMLGDVFARRGARQMPYAGFYIGPESIATAEITKWGNRRQPRTTIPVHLRMQPVIDVSPDGRSTRFRTRLFSIISNRETAGTLFGGMYPNDQAVLEDGVWKLWSVAIDEFYLRSANYRNGWVGVPAEPAEKVPDMLIAADPPEIPLTALGQRQQGYIPGSRQFNPYVHNGPAYPGYPSATPMWFSYINPVSGRVPEYYWPDCVTCAAFPETSLQANGY